MGQNMVGWVSMKVKGKVGDRVRLRFAEILQDDGAVYLENLRGARVTDIYTLKGIGTELYEPSFTYHGFRFVEITGYPETPDINDFEGKVVHDELYTTGQLETSNNTINQIHRNSYWGMRSYYEYLAGIKNAPDNAGFKNIVMKPHPVEGLDYVKASFNSIHGIIKSA